MWVGTNNHDNTAEEVAGGIEAIVRLINAQQPQAKVIVLVRPAGRCAAGGSGKPRCHPLRRARRPSVAGSAHSVRSLRRPGDRSRERSVSPSCPEVVVEGSRGAESVPGSELALETLLGVPVLAGSLVPRAEELGGGVGGAAGS